eukprot:TRINITY_DN1122_c0_g1_i1.p1 TRINITY_DN1122_c0_g1~~TRINITY_DN1122_c0_g1_i1.p1  ORF type:complete len:1035 (-),score=166.89 TRINITY_DN1122_c0_g1_i1:139-2832(-)
MKPNPDLRNRFHAKLRPEIEAKLPTDKLKHTPFEQQYLALRAQYPDVLLVIECGYKFRFMGEDAKTAAKLLNIYSWRDHSFETASIPVHRLSVHVKRLVEAGHKVGVVRQAETAALKAVSASKSGPFARKLSALYTKATLVMDDIDVHDDSMLTLSGAASGKATYLLCLCESEETERSVRIALVACDTSSGHIIWDCFEDDILRSALETRLAHLQPSELLVPEYLSKQTDRMLKHYGAGEDAYRVERRSADSFDLTETRTVVADYYASQDDKSATDILPELSVQCLGALIMYLQEFGLDTMLKLQCNFQHFSNRTHMLLSGNTLRNLEILREQSTGAERGSLYWLLNHTITPMGARLLKSWVCQPLLIKSEIELRRNAVAELVSSPPSALDALMRELKQSSDLERGLCRVLHRKCSPEEYVLLMRNFLRLCDVLPASTEFKSAMLRDLFNGIPDVRPEIVELLAIIDETSVNDKTHLFRDQSAFPEVSKQQAEVQKQLDELDAHLVAVSKQLQLKLEYRTVSGAEFLLEIPLAREKIVPKDWLKISATKQVLRFHSPFIVAHSAMLAQHRDLLKMACDAAWLDYLSSVCERYLKFHRVAHGLAVFDCLLSLAVVARLPGYVQPTLVDEQRIEISNGRHPIVEAVSSQPFVPNDTCLSATELRSMIITGPNMGGKSCYIRQVVLIVVLAQIGSFVPADKATIGVCDAVFTRMGATDDLMKGRSTFFVELQETSDILAAATSRSLVVLDELGRGTATHDGTAIAAAVLQYITQEKQCFTLFVTHYPIVGALEQALPQCVRNFHLGFLVHNSTSLTFLFKLQPGIADSSFGLNVARMAHIPDSILAVADRKSHQIQATIENDCAAFAELRKLEDILSRQPDNAQLQELTALSERLRADTR